MRLPPAWPTPWEFISYPLLSGSVLLIGTATPVQKSSIFPVEQKKAHIVRAAEESIAYQIKDVVEDMHKEAGFKLQELRVDGGPTKDEFVMQFLADILDVPVIRSKTEELSGTGAMYMGGLALNIWSTYEEIEAMREVEKKFESRMILSDRDKLYQGWLAAVGKVLTKEKR